MSLGDVFGPAAVGKKSTAAPGLAGRLAPMASTPATAIAPPVATPPAIPVAPPVAAGQAGASTREDDNTKQISIYVLPHVPDAIRAAKRGRTNAAVVYDAIEACVTQLPALLAARRTVPAPAGPGGGLFARQASDRPAEETRIPWTFKVTSANRAVLDSLVTRYGATSRSELVAAALEHTFPVGPR